MQAGDHVRDHRTRSIPQELRPRGVKYHINPTGRFVVGGPQGDAGSHRAQDHRRYVRRDGPPRRRRVQRQGSVEGRSLGALRRALGRQEHRRGGTRAPVRGADRVRDRCRASRCRWWSTRSAPRPYPRPSIMRGGIARCSTSRPRASSPRSICASRSMRRRRRTGTSGAPPSSLGSGKSARTLFSWERTDRVSALKRAVKDGTAPATNGSGRSPRTASFATSALEDPADGDG